MKIYKRYKHGTKRGGQRYHIKRASNFNIMVDKKLREPLSPSTLTKKYINYRFQRIKKLSDPWERKKLEMRYEQFMRGPLAGLLNRELSYTKEEFDQKKDEFIKMRKIPFPRIIGIGTSTPYADSVLEKERKELNVEADYRKKFKELYKEKGKDISYNDINKLYDEYLEALPKRGEVWIKDDNL